MEATLIYDHHYFIGGVFLLHFLLLLLFIVSLIKPTHHIWDPLANANYSLV